MFEKPEKPVHTEKRKGLRSWKRWLVGSAVALVLLAITLFYATPRRICGCSPLPPTLTETAAPTDR